MRINRKVSLFFGVAGAILGLGGFFFYLIWGEPAWIGGVLELLAVIFLTLFLITHFEMLKDFSTRRSTKFGANSVLMAVIFVAILGIVNFILARHDARFDLSESGAFSLSPQTVNVVKNLQNEVKFSGFFKEQSALRAQAKDLFENYQHESPRVKYELIDPDKKPQVVKQYGVTEYDTIVLESGGQSATVRTVSEQELTSALIRISRGAKKAFYFVEGHGERSIGDADRQGYSYLKESLEKQGFAVKKLLLLSEKHIPDDAAVVVIGGPQRPFADEELGAVEGYLKKGGQLFVLLDALAPSNLEGLLSKWGAKFENDIILDMTSGLGGAVPIVNPGTYPNHPITEKFNLATFYPLARSVAFDASREGTFQFDPLLQTGPNSWLTRKVEGDLSIDPNRDKKGPIIIGGVIQFKKEAPLPVKEEEAKPPVAADPAKKARLVIIGDSDFGSNAIVRSSGNGDLFQNVVTWLAEEEDLVSIRPQEAKTSSLLMTQQQIKATLYTSVLILPTGILIAGLSIWRRRRRL
jgi:ABC-type uncharacterized transport system involved in gliding motility auxiliary subunit